MEYIYGAMLLHSAGKEINEENLKKLVEATGEKADEAKIKALVASLEGVDIEKVISEAALPVQVTTPAASGGAEASKKEEKKSEEEEKKESEVASSGLGALFG